jgi:hypothetical protein
MFSGLTVVSNETIYCINENEGEEAPDQEVFRHNGRQSQGWSPDDEASSERSG